MWCNFYVYHYKVILQLSVQWLGGRMLDSRSREPGHESPKYNGAIDGKQHRQKQNPYTVLDTLQ